MQTTGQRLVECKNHDGLEAQAGLDTIDQGFDQCIRHTLLGSPKTRKEAKNGSYFL